MGALAPSSPWIPEDDVLLKNAVEAGASLESLAKGAVRFSRKFSVQELKDRWYALLYDPVVSAAASARILELEWSAPAPTSNRSGNAKENKCDSGKRKAESVRSSYYAMRKRICSEPFNSMGLNFLVAPSNNSYIEDGDETLYENFITGDPTSAPFGLERSDMIDTMQNLMDGGTGIGLVVAAADTFHAGVPNPAENDCQMEQDNIYEEIPHLLKENLPVTRNESEVGEFNPSKELPDCRQFNANALGTEPSYTLDQTNGDEGNMNQAFNSPVADNGASFHNLEYSSSLPGLPIWKTLTEPAMPLDVGLTEKDICTRDAFERLDDIDVSNTRTSEYDAHVGMEVKAELPSGDFSSPSAPVSNEGYLEELSNSLLNFTNEELMLMSADEKDVIDKSYYDGLSSLLLYSPKNYVCQEQTIRATDPETSVAPAMNPINSSSTHPGVVDDNMGSQDADHMTCHSEALMLLSKGSSYQHPEVKDGVICCMLNTEDLEIPCNDDVFLPNRFLQSSDSTIVEWNVDEVNKAMSSLNDYSVSQRKSKKGQKKPGEPLGSSQSSGSHLPEMVPKPQLGNFGAEGEFSKTDPTDTGSKKGLGHNGHNAVTDPLPGIRREETNEKALATRLTCKSNEIRNENPDIGCGNVKSYPRTNASAIREEVNPSSTIKDHKPLTAEVIPMGIADSEPEPNPQTDQLGNIESDDDVPCYSDIEAMILDMDLDPDDQDFYSREEVSRYQHDDAKRRIIRLEQGAHSYLQRAIASHGAFAILYGRHSKHYIKKPEVLLGRATEDVLVDVDLGREGRGNKISRQQAIIKMDKGGCFYLKNLGKCSILVNSMEVASGRSLSLSSSCLIEIRGMPFIFETNQKRVKQYLDSINKVS